MRMTRYFLAGTIVFVSLFLFNPSVRANSPGDVTIPKPTSCSTPSASPGTGTEISSESWTSTYTYWTLADNPTFTFVSDGKGGGTTVTNHNYYAKDNTGYCSTHPSRDPSSGYDSGGKINFSAYATGGGGDSGNGYATGYFVYSATVSVAATSYEDEAPPKPTCTKYRGNGSDDCYSELKSEETRDSVSVKTCYWYIAAYTSVMNNGGSIASPGSGTKQCTTRYFVQTITIDSPVANVYTGLPTSYNATAHYSDNHTTDISTMNGVWSSSKNDGTSAAYTNFIGDSRRRSYTGLRSQDDAPAAAAITTAHDSNRSKFYAQDPKGGAYTLTAIYNINNAVYGSSSWKIPVSNASPFSPWKSIAYTTLQLHGIKKTKIIAEGDFSPHPDPSITDQKSLEVSRKFSLNALSNGAYGTAAGSAYDAWDPGGNVDFITGHWYNFRSFILYDDNTNGQGGNTVDPAGAGYAGWREVTSANGSPEIFWQADPWYQNGYYETYNTQFAQNGTAVQSSVNNGTSGMQHRIPRTGWNKVMFRYFDDVAPWNSQGEGVTKKTDIAWAHKIVNLTLRGAQNQYANNLPIVGDQNLTPPNPSDANVNKTNVTTYPMTSVNYTAWITWSDDPLETDAANGSPSYAGYNPYSRGNKENWTSIVKWYGDDYAKAPGFYQFKMRGAGDWRSVSADVGDLKNLKSGFKYWTYVADKLILHVNDGCGGSYLIIYGCATPSGGNFFKWQTQLLNGNPMGAGSTASPTVSFLAPPQYYLGAGVSQSAQWSDPPLVPKNQYFYNYEFPVTGLSNDTGTK